MSIDNLLQLFLRFLPAIAVVALGFWAAADQRTRDQWTNLLYQFGSIRPEQREDLKLQRSVRWPFFIVAFCMLYWPLRYYQHATRPINVTSASDIRQGKKSTDLGSPEAPATGNTATGNAATANAAPASNAAPGAAPGAAPAATTTAATAVTPPPTTATTTAGTSTGGPRLQ